MVDPVTLCPHDILTTDHHDLADALVVHGRDGEGRHASNSTASRQLVLRRTSVLPVSNPGSTRRPLVDM